MLRQINVTVLTDEHVPLTYDANAAVYYAAQSLEQESSVSVYLGSQRVYYQHAYANSSSEIVLTTEWGPVVQGASRGDFTLRDNHTLTGDIDGRTFRTAFPFDPSKVRFSDDGGSPQLRTKTDLTSALKRLSDKVDAAQKQCVSNEAPSNATQQLAPREASAIFGLISSRDGLDRTMDPGHFSDTQDKSSCKVCIGFAIAGIAAAEAACAAACVASLGLACPACLVGAQAAGYAAVTACQTSSECCPQLCGDDGLCCGGGETCLHGARQGLCCGPGQTACSGLSCCQQDQTCISTGPSKGCCPDQAVCGGTCCPGDTDVCINNQQCCPAGYACGSVCCHPKGPGDLFGQICASASDNLCCYDGQINAEGICCSPGEVKCSGQCCRGLCQSNGQCAFTIKCPHDLSTDQSCQTSADCPGNGYCRENCCYHRI